MAGAPASKGRTSGSRDYGRSSSSVALFIVGALSQYGGATIAIGLFEAMGPTLVAWLRFVGASAVLWLLARPSPELWSADTRRDVVVLGVVLGTMNVSFYEAIARLPLGTAVAIEFIGPITVGVLSNRSARNLTALGVASIGVVVLAGVEWRASTDGLLWIGLAALCWGGYIVFGKRVAEADRGEGGGFGGLAAASVVALLAYSPVGILGLARGLRPGWVGRFPVDTGAGIVGFGWLPVAAGVLVGVLSSAVPYGLDQVVLRRVSRSEFAVLLAILPATAAVVGAVALGQVPNVAELLGILAVIAAVLLRDR